MEHPFSARKRQCRPQKMTIPLDDPVEDPVEDLCERMAQLHLWSTEPLYQFELFPRLPKELRRLIFKFALPSTNKMITATAHCRELMPKKVVCVFFTIPPQRPGMPPQSKECKDVRLLELCWESREVFLENRKGCLPGAGKNLIRFDPKSTPIFIENYEILARNTALKQAYRSGSWRPVWLAQVERLALGKFKGGNWLLSREDEGNVSPLSSLQSFQNLRELWLAVSDNCSKSMLHPENANDYEWLMARFRFVIQPHLDSWAAQFGPGHVLPKLRLMTYGIGSVGLGLYP